MKYPKLREIGEALKALVFGPYTLKFPRQPSVPFENFRGQPEFHEEDCIGCAACAMVCPTGCIKISDEIKNGRGKRKLEIHLDNCIFCAQCERNCLTKEGIKLSNKKYDLSTLDRSLLRERVEKELLICEICQSVIAPWEQVIWVAKKIGPAAFSNPTLMLTLLGEVTGWGENVTYSQQPLRRADRIRILCPRCRRVTTLEE